MPKQNPRPARKRLLLILGTVALLIIAAILTTWLLVKPPSHNQAESQTNPAPNSNSSTPESSLETEAKAFARRFMDAVDHGLKTGDFSSAGTMYAEECTFCKGMANTYSGLYRDGGKLEGGGYYINPALRAVEQPNGWVVVTVEGNLAAYRIVYPDRTTRDYPTEPDKTTFTVKKNPDGKWLIMKWEDD